MKGNDQWMSMAKNIGNPVGNFGLMFNDKREPFKHSMKHVRTRPYPGFLDVLRHHGQYRA